MTFFCRIPKNVRVQTTFIVYGNIGSLEICASKYISAKLKKKLTYTYAAQLLFLFIQSRDVTINREPLENRLKYVTIQIGWDAKQIAIELGVGVYMNVFLRGTYCL